MSTTAVDPDLARIDAELDALLSECDPKKVDNATFRGARFDRGLAWVHFPIGCGGLGVSPKFQKIVNEELAKAGGPSAHARNPIGFNPVFNRNLAIN